MIYYRDGAALMETTVGGSPPTAVSTRRLFQGAYLSDAGYNNYDVAADGKHFLMLESVDRQAETIVIYNWAAELRRTWQRP